MYLGGSGYLINFIYTAIFNRACMIQSVYLNYLIKEYYCDNTDYISRWEVNYLCVCVCVICSFLIAWNI